MAAPPREGGSAFVPVKLLELDAPSAPPPSDVAAKRARPRLAEARGAARWRSACRTAAPRCRSTLT